MGYPTTTIRNHPRQVAQRKNPCRRPHRQESQTEACPSWGHLVVHPLPAKTSLDTTSQIHQEKPPVHLPHPHKPHPGSYHQLFERWRQRTPEKPRQNTPRATPRTPTHHHRLVACTAHQRPTRSYEHRQKTKVGSAPNSPKHKPYTTMKLHKTNQPKTDDPPCTIMESNPHQPTLWEYKKAG